MTMINVNNAEGDVLDYLVAKCLGVVGISPSRCCDCIHLEERAIRDGAQLRCRLGGLCWESGGWSDDPFGEEISEWQGVHQKCPLRLYTKTEAYSTDPAQAYPIIDREDILCGPSPFPSGKYAAGIGSDWDHCKHIQTGPTILIAAMRCYVASKLGDVVEVPDELLQRNKHG